MVTFRPPNFKLLFSLVGYCLVAGTRLPGGWACVVTGEGKRSGHRNFKTCSAKLALMQSDMTNMVAES